MVHLTPALINLFLSAWFIRRFGVKAAMFQQTFWAALRNLCQIYAQTVGGATGMKIIQVTQLFNLLGSGGGFQLCANSYVAMLSEDHARTANFGILGGIFMLGSSIGYSTGGSAERYFGYLAPFQLAFILLCFSTVFGMFFLPHFTPEHEDKPHSGRAGFLAPLKVFIPRKIGNANRRDWNLLYLGLGTFFSVLATGYAPMMLQLIATDVFDFTPYTSGYMLSLTLFVRFIFLTGMFPTIISRGRRWMSPQRAPSISSDDSGATIACAAGKSASTPSSACPSRSSSLERTPKASQIRGLPVPPVPNIPRRSSQSHSSPSSSAFSRADYVPSRAISESPPPYACDNDDMDLEPIQGCSSVPHAAAFDLLFLRSSILLDGILTSAVTFATAPWHMYLAATALPFASGTGPASKGVMLEFVPPEERGRRDECDCAGGEARAGVHDWAVWLPVRVAERAQRADARVRCQRRCCHPGLPCASACHAASAPERNFIVVYSIMVMLHGL